MDNTTRRLMMGAAGAVSPAYIEDVFSTWLYTGNSSTQTITNGIDLSGKGGLVWIKGRSGATGHRFTDTARGATKSLESNSTAAEATESTGLTAFNADGFALGADADYNTSSATYASWTFRKQAKFFDVVTWTGNEGFDRAITHSLGSTPGCIIAKCTNTATTSWMVWHRNINTNDIGFLEQTTAITGNSQNQTGGGYLFLSNANSTTFTVNGGASDSSQLSLNRSGRTYVAYLFAHDAGGFGDSGSDSVIKCGSFTTDGSGNATVDLGWEPQWLLWKSSSNVQNWYIHDNMRGLGVFTAQALYPNLSNAEGGYSAIQLTSTGFTCSDNASRTYIYIAIRRGPMKTPTDATKVFAALTNTGNGNFTTGQVLTTGFPVDLAYVKYRTATFDALVDRIRGLTSSVASNANKILRFTSTAAEGGSGDFGGGDSNISYAVGQTNGETTINYAFRRAPGFFDVVAYTGTGVARTLSHNLGVVPELIVVKCRNISYSFEVYSSAIANTEYLRLNTDAAKASGADRWNSTNPTSTNFTVGTGNSVNSATAGTTYIAYLFASCPGVSKVGSYTGTGTTLQINCGFTSGARFVLIKRTDSTGDWYVWDSARGIVAGNDPYLLLNSTAAEVTGTDYVDTYSAGFEISSTAPAAINANGGSYIYLSVA